MKKNFNSDALDMIAERAFSEGYKQGALEKMFAAEGEGVLAKVKDTLWGKEGGFKKNWGRRTATIAVPTATAAGLAYLAYKKKKAKEAAEALEEAAERAYSEYEYLSQKMYAADDVDEEVAEDKKSGLSKKDLAIAAALSAGTGAGAFGLSKYPGDYKHKLALLDAELAGKDVAALQDNKLQKLGRKTSDKINKAAGKWGGRAALAGITLAPGAAYAGYKTYKSRKNAAADSNED